MGPGAAVRRRWQASAFAPVQASPVLRRLLPALAVSAVGDGMSAVGVAWLAIRIASPADRGLVVGVAVAAYTLPGAAGAVLLARPLRRLAGRRLVAADATLRAVALALIPLLYASGALRPGLYVALLAASSLLHAWGISGQYTLVAEHLPPEDRTAGNALLSGFGAVAYVVGPLLAGLVVAAAGPAVPIAADAASFAVLAVAAATVRGNREMAATAKASEATGNSGTTAATEAGEASGNPGLTAVAEASEARGNPALTAAAEAEEVGEPDRARGFAVIARSRPLAGLLVLTLIYYFLYGPVEVALPLYVTGPLHGGAGLLGLFWFVFGIGATAGSLTAGLARKLPLWPVLAVAVIGWGAALAPLGLLRLTVPALACFAAGGLLYAPYPALSATLFQRESPPELLSQVLAARGALTVLAAPLGTALGGPLTTWLGAQHTLLLSAAATIGVGLATSAILTTGRHRARAQG
jgi:predicted MFS family arabinose efflux permease